MSNTSAHNTAELLDFKVVNPTISRAHAEQGDKHCCFCGVHMEQGRYSSKIFILQIHPLPYFLSRDNELCVCVCVSAYVPTCMETCVSAHVCICVTGIFKFQAPQSPRPVYKGDINTKSQETHHSSVQSQSPQLFQILSPLSNYPDSCFIHTVQGFEQWSAEEKE